MSAEIRPNYTRTEWVRMEWAHFALTAKFKSLGLAPISERTFEAVEKMETTLRNHYAKADKS
jgi:hypothetical protein